jgi:heme A synthase
VRRAAVAVGLFTSTEAAIGAVLVLLRKVGDDASAARALLMAFHLSNTFFLLAALATGWWWARGGARPAGRASRTAALFGVALAGTLCAAAAGAVTALGDTLFPAASLRAGLAQDLSPTAHFLLRLRAIHPVLALVVAAGWIALAMRFAGGAAGPARRLGRVVAAVVCAQLIAGAATLVLLAPVALQLVHLLLADLLWIAGVLYALEALAAEAPLATACYKPPSCAPIRSSPR